MTSINNNSNGKNELFHDSIENLNENNDDQLQNENDDLLVDTSSAEDSIENSINVQKIKADNANPNRTPQQAKPQVDDETPKVTTNDSAPSHNQMPSRSLTNSPLSSSTNSLNVTKQKVNGNKMSPGLAKRIPNSPTSTTPNGTLDFELEKNLKDLNLSPTHHHYQPAPTAKTALKLREMTPDSIDEQSQPNSITNSFNENVQDFDTPLSTLSQRVTHLPAHASSTAQMPASMMTIPMSIPMNLPMNQAYGLPINAMPIQYLLTQSMLANPQQQQPQSPVLQPQLTFQQQQQLAFQQQQYFMQLQAQQAQAQFVHQQQQTSKSVTATPTHATLNTTANGFSDHFADDDDDDNNEDFESLKVKRIPNNLKGLKLNSLTGGARRLAYTKASIIENEDQDEEQRDECEGEGEGEGGESTEYEHEYEDGQQKIKLKSISLDFNKFQNDLKKQRKQQQQQSLLVNIDSSKSMPKLEEGLSEGDECDESASRQRQQPLTHSQQNGNASSSSGSGGAGGVGSDFIYKSQRHHSYSGTSNEKQQQQQQRSQKKSERTRSTNDHSHFNSNQHHPQNVSKSSSTHSMSPSSSSPASISPTTKLSKAQNVNTDNDKDYDTDEETNKLLDTQYQQASQKQQQQQQKKPNATKKEEKKHKAKEVMTRTIMDPDNPEVLIEGVLFRARYLGSTQLSTDSNPTKLTRMMQAQEAVSRIKAPEGETQPSVEVDLFVSTEKIMVLNTDLQIDKVEIMMDHSLRSISYIADIGDLIVLMAKRRTYSEQDSKRQQQQQKLICHVFESEEAQVVAQSIGQAFQMAYMEYLKANGIEDVNIMKDLDYQEVLNQQEIMGTELKMFAKKECQKEVIIPKAKNENLGIVIVESGWGSMLPTVVVANMMPNGPSARCGHLNIGDQIISVNGISLVGLPLSTCQTQIKSIKHLTIVRLVVVPCPPVVEVLIKRPDTKYQLGFSVQDGIICSLLRGGIAERGGVRVGHRIIEINNQSVVATVHEKIVSMLANSVGELRMKTMPTQMFRLLTGQEQPQYI